MSDEADTFDILNVSWVWTPEDLAHLIGAIEACEEVVADLESTGLEEHATTGGTKNGGVAARIVLASFTLPMPEDEEEPTTWLLPLSHPDSPWLGRWRETMRTVAQAMKPKPLIGHNIKYDCRWINALCGVDLSHSIVWDTQISSHLLDENKSAKLKERAPVTFGIPAWNDDVDLSKPGAAEHIPLIDLGLYAARDTYWTRRLAQLHRRQMFLTPGNEGPQYSEEYEDARMGKLATWCSMPTTATLTAIEQRGMRLDIAWVKEQLAEHMGAYSESFATMSRMYEKQGVTPECASFAPTSHWFRDWAAAAVEKGDLRVAELTPTGKPRWSKGVLVRQARGGSEVADWLLELRGHSKKCEFLNAWLAYTTPEGRIFASYNAGSVVTGRLSCVSPETLIDMPRDMTRYPDGVPLREVKVGDWVYSFDMDMELTLRQVEWVGPTKVDETIYVTFENSDGERRVLQCTPDHLVRLYQGDWRHAAYLLKNTGRYGEATTSNRVLSMVRRGWKEPNGNDQYLQFFPHSNSRHTSPSVSEGNRNGSTAGGKDTEHRWIMERVLGRRLSIKWDVNHKDGNKCNNHPSNLEYLSASEHRRNTHRDGTWGKIQPGTSTYIGKNDFRVVSIAQGPVIEVWDMTVPEDHCFVANGIVVHNSSGPNMQQVTKVLRPAFVPSPGFVLADLDYSQIEMRVAAFISGSVPMIEAFQRGDDLHSMLAGKVTGKPWQEVTKIERQSGKAGNFGLLYGMGAFGFREYAETVYGVSLTMSEATRVYRAFFEMWDGIGQWHAKSIATVQRNGQVVSPIGRVRRLPNIWDGSEQMSSFCERAAINSPVQGFASDIMQIAAASIEGTLPGSTAVRGAKIVCTVHDDIIVEVPEDNWQEVTAECQARMVGVHPVLLRMGCDFTVPLEAVATVGTRWGLDDIGVLK